MQEGKRESRRIFEKETLDGLEISSAGLGELERYIRDGRLAGSEKSTAEKADIYEYCERIKKEKPRQSGELTGDDVRMLWLTGAADTEKAAKDGILFVPPEADYADPGLVGKYESVYTFGKGLEKTEDYLERTEKQAERYVRQKYPDGPPGEKKSGGKRKTEIRPPYTKAMGTLNRAAGLRPSDTYAGEGVRAIYSYTAVPYIAGAVAEDFRTADIRRRTGERLVRETACGLMPEFRDRSGLRKKLKEESEERFDGADLTAYGFGSLKEMYSKGEYGGNPLTEEQKATVNRILALQCMENPGRGSIDLAPAVRMYGVGYAGTGYMDNPSDRKRMISAVRKSVNEDREKLDTIRRMEKDIRKAGRSMRRKGGAAPESADVLKLEKLISGKERLLSNLEAYDRAAEKRFVSGRAAAGRAVREIQPTYFGTGLAGVLRYASYSGRAAEAVTGYVKRRKAESGKRPEGMKKSGAKPRKTKAAAERIRGKISSYSARAVSAAMSPLDFAFFRVRKGEKAVSLTAVKVCIAAFVFVCCVSGMALVGTGILQGVQGMSLSSDESAEVRTIDGRVEDGRSVTEDRLNLCRALDGALRIYMKRIYADKDAVREISESGEVKNDIRDGNWYSYGKTREYSVPELGRSVAGIQTGIYCSFYNGDGEETGFRSNAKDILSAANVWMEETGTATGLYKSYVEKLWNFSHIAAYNPRRQETGQYVYPCSMTEEDGCYSANVYGYRCSNANTPLYDPGGNFADPGIYEKCSRDSSIVPYSEHGCEKHTYVFCGSDGTRSGENEGILCDEPIAECDSCFAVQVGGGMRFYCRGHGTDGVCTGECEDIREKTIGHVRCFDGTIDETIITPGYYPAFETKKTYFLWEKDGRNCPEGEDIAAKCGCTGLYTSIEGGDTVYRIIDSGCRYYGRDMRTCPGCMVRNTDGSYSKVYHNGERYFTEMKVHISFSCPGNHSCTIRTYACRGYCPGHVIHYCTGHVDVDVTCVTLFLEDGNSLVNLGIYDRTDVRTELIRTSTCPEGEERRVEIRTPSEGASCIYSDVDAFRDIRTVHRLPAVDYGNLEDEETGTVDFGLVDNVGTAASTLKFFSKDCNGFMEEGASDMNLLLKKHFECFDGGVYRWTDYNDAIPEGVYISHLSGYYSKFSTGHGTRDNVFEGWYCYDGDGYICSYTGSGGNVFFRDTGNIDRAVSLCRDDWKTEYGLDFH